jgi:hypothetical protein
MADLERPGLLLCGAFSVYTMGSSSDKGGERPSEDHVEAIA